MKNLSRDQAGFSFLEVLLVLVVIGAVAFVGLRMMGRQSAVESPASPQASVVSTAPSQIKTKADLAQAASSLNSSQLDSQLDPSQFNQDLGSLY